MDELIHRDQLQRLIAQGAQLVEVLPAKEYEEDHLPGAISIPLSKISSTSTVSLDHGRPIVVYCWDIA